MADEVAPTDAAAVEQLVRRFYATPDPEERTALDLELTRLQRRPEGFSFADQLLHSDFPEVRLYGANTFIVKIKHDLATLDEDQRSELQSRLLQWLSSSMQTAASQPVMAKKVCSAVVECFIATSGEWSGCISDVLALFLSADDHGDPTNTMNATDQLGVVWFISTLVEMVGAREPDLASTHALRQLIDRDFVKLVFVVSSIFNSQARSNHSSIEHASLACDALLCLSSLILWTRESTDLTEAVEQLRQVMHWIIQGMSGSEFFEIASSTIFEVLTEHPAFLATDHWNAIADTLLSDWAVGLLQSGDFDESGPVAIAKILLSYAEARWETLCAGTNTQRDQRVLECCLYPLKGNGVPNVDDEIAYMAVDLWTLLVEELQLTDQPLWPDFQNILLPEAIKSTRLRTFIPSADRLSTFTPYDADCFASFRGCAGDFMETTARFLDPSRLSSLFTDDIRQSLPAQLWSDVEADLFCLNSIISKGGYHNYGDVLPIVRPLFYSVGGDTPMIETLLEHGSQIPSPVRKATTACFVNAREVLRLDQSILSTALSCLFRWLQEPSGEIKLRLASAISKLCSEARTSLVPSGPWLCSELESYATAATKRDHAAYERLFGAIAAIVQACTFTSWEDALQMIRRLLTLVQHDVDRCLEAASSDAATAKEHGLIALRCLASMGMAFRAPEVEVLDDEEDAPSNSNPWALNEHITDEIRTRIMAICGAVYNQFHEAEELKAICDVLRAGYTEDGPSPFVFPLSYTLHLLQSNSLSHAGIGELLSNCLILLKRHRRKKTEEIKLFALECLRHITSQLYDIFGGDPSAEPEIAGLAMEFFRAYLPGYIEEVMWDAATRDGMFSFAVGCFSSHEILSKASAAQFWSSYLGDRNISTDSSSQAILETFGRKLTTIAAEQACGGASRSELECVTVVIRAIVARGGEFRNYLREAVASVDVQSIRATEEQKRVFVEKVLGYMTVLATSAPANSGSLRGGPLTRKVVEEFWALCQGTYVPAA